MAKGYTLEELQGMGGQPATSSTGGGMSLEQLQKLEEAGSGNFFQRLKARFNERISSGLKSRQASETGQQTTAESVLQTVGQGAGFVGDIGFEALKTATPQPIEESVGAAASKVAETKPVQSAMQSYQDWASQNPRAARDLEAVINIGSLIPVGKGAVAGSKLATQAAERASVGISTAGKAGKGIAREVYGSAITPNVQEAERLLAYKARTPFGERLKAVLSDEKLPERPITRADTGFETKGVVGTRKTIGVGAKRQADELWKNEIAPAVDQSGEMISKDELFAPIERRIESTVEPGRKKALQQAFEAIQEDYAEIDSFDLKRAQRVKSEIDSFTPEKVFRGQNIVNEYRTLQNDIANAIRTKTYNSLKDQNIRKKYIDYGNLSELQKIGVKAISEAGTKGGFGSFWTTMWDAATTPVKTIGGKVLYKVGNKVEFVGEKGIRTFGQFLEKNGYKKPELLYLLTPAALSGPTGDQERID